MDQEQTSGSTNTGIGSFNAGSSICSPSSSPSTGATGSEVPPASGVKATPQPAPEGGLFGSTNTTDGMFCGKTATSTGFSATSGFSAITASGGLFTNSSSGLFGNNQNNSAFGAKPATGNNAAEVKAYQDNLRRYKIVKEKNHLKSKLHDREAEFNKLEAVFEKLIPEYHQLKNQHEIDSRAMQKVMQQAGEWYQQNKQLQRKCTALMLALPSGVELLDATNAEPDTSSNEEVEFLKRTVSELREQVVALQKDAIENSSGKFYSDATLIQVAVLKKIETEKQKYAEQKKEIQLLRNRLEKHNCVSKLLVEISELTNNADKSTQMAQTYKSEVSKVNKHVKILTHQSALELGERLGLQQGEKDALQDALEEQGAGNRNTGEDLQLKKDKKHEDTVILSWEEKIKLAEEDAQKALERAERIEKILEELEREHAEYKNPGKPKLMSRINYFTTGEEKEIKIENSIDATVDQIKELQFQFKSIDQNVHEKPKDDQPEAVKDMIQILGTLRDKRNWRNIKKLATEQE